MTVGKGEGFASSPSLGLMHMPTKTQHIRDLRQWPCWRIEERDGKPTLREATEQGIRECLTVLRFDGEVLA